MMGAAIDGDGSGVGAAERPAFNEGAERTLLRESDGEDRAPPSMGTTEIPVGPLDTPTLTCAALGETKAAQRESEVNILNFNVI
jgi:hypothetical protein